MRQSQNGDLSFHSDPVSFAPRLRWFAHLSNGALLTPQSALLHPALDLTDGTWGAALGVRVSLK